MFVCADCLNKHFTNEPSITQSFGDCESCDQRAACSDIPSADLRRRTKKKKNGSPYH